MSSMGNIFLGAFLENRFVLTTYKLCWTWAQCICMCFENSVMSICFLPISLHSYQWLILFHKGWKMLSFTFLLIEMMSQYIYYYHYYTLTWCLKQIPYMRVFGVEHWQLYMVAVALIHSNIYPFPLVEPCHTSHELTTETPMRLKYTKDENVYILFQ